MSAAARRRVDIAPPQETRHALRGHSGARIVLHAGQARSFVRKTAASPSQNERLLGQAEKQRRLGRSGIPFPQVLMSGFDAQGCAFFDMAYIPGRTLADAVVNAMPLASGTVFAAVERMLWLFRSCRGEALDAGAFKAKIAAIRDGAHGNDAARDCAQRLLGFDWNGIPASPSHGDLTLENIMLGPGRDIVFIDCDEPWVSSYWLDLGKLYQDLRGHWCLRRLPEPDVQRANAVEKLMQLDMLLRPLVERDLAERLPQLVALNLFRALPYAADIDTAGFICARVRRMLEHPR